jgi:hypothetical protein
MQERTLNPKFTFAMVTIRGAAGKTSILSFFSVWGVLRHSPGLLVQATLTPRIRRQNYRETRLRKGKGGEKKQLTVTRRNRC